MLGGAVDFVDSCDDSCLLGCALSGPEGCLDDYELGFIVNCQDGSFEIGELEIE